MIITRATNIWINFIMFTNNICEKRIFEVFSSTRKYVESAGLSMRISHLW